MLRRAVLQLRRRPRRATAAAAVAEHHHQRPPATDTTPRAPFLCLAQRMGISSTARRARHAEEGKGLVPPTSWSIHDLQLLKKDVAGQAQEPPLSPEELTRLAGYAHLDVGPGSKLEEGQGQLQEDLGAIIRCMTLLQKADLEGLSREEMYAPPEHAAPATPLRDDVVTEGGAEQQRRLLALSEETARQQYVVPTVVDKGQA